MALDGGYNFLIFLINKNSFQNSKKERKEKKTIKCHFQDGKLNQGHSILLWQQIHKRVGKIINNNYIVYLCLKQERKL